VSFILDNVHALHPGVHASCSGCRNSSDI